jgi:hypothetical protein
MSLSGIKSITTLIGCNFYQKIMKKYQTGKKNTFIFPTMFFFKEKRPIFPSKIDFNLKFTLHLNQQNILPIFICKNLPHLRGKLSRLKTEKETPQSLFKLKDDQNTKYLTKLFFTALKIPLGSSIASEKFLARNTSTNNIIVFSFLKSLFSRLGNITNSINKILKLSFLPLSNIFYQQRTHIVSSDSITLDPKTLNFENNMETLNSRIFVKKIYNFEKQNVLSSLTVKNIPIIKKIHSGLNVEKKSQQSIVKQNSALKVDNEANAYISQEALKTQKEYHAGSDFVFTEDFSTNKFQTENISINKTRIFSLLKSLIIRAGNILNNTQKVMKLSFLPVNNDFYYPKKNLISPDILVEDLKVKGRIPEFLIKSEKKNRIAVFEKYIERFSHFIFSNISAYDPKIINYENNLANFNSRTFWENTYFRLLNFENNPTFVYKKNKLKYWLMFKYKLSWDNLGRQNILPFSIVKKTPIINEIFQHLNTEKINLQLLLKPKNTQNTNDVSNVYVSKATFKILRMYKIASEIFPTGNTIKQKNSFFSLLDHVRVLMINSEKSCLLTVHKKYLHRFLPLRFSNTYTHNLFLKSLIFKAVSTVTNSNRILKPLFFSENSIYDQQTINSNYSEAKKVSSQTFNSKNNNKILILPMLEVKKNYESLTVIRNSTFIDRKSIVRNHPVSENKLPGVFLQDNSLFNKTYGLKITFRNDSNWITPNKSFLKNCYNSFEYVIPSFVQNNKNYTMRPESLVFKDHGSIEQEIEQIKKTVIETRKAISEKKEFVFGKEDIKKYIDINRISSQVYQNLERAIRMERERRGA